MSTPDNTAEENTQENRTPSQDEVKAAFRAALARKNQRGHGPQENHLDGQSKAHGPHGAVGGPHAFQRKTG